MSNEIPFLNNSNFDNNNPLIQKVNNNQNVDNNNNNLEKINNMNFNNDDLNESIKSNNLNDNKLMSSSEWVKYFKESKINLEEINKLLLSNVESMDNENIKLKNALYELINDLKEKENSLDESLKIITKLKNNYSTLFHQYQSLEKKCAKLNEENDSLKKNCDISNKNKYNTEGINKKNEYLKDELNKVKKDSQLLKNNYNLKHNECIKLNKEMNEIKLIMEDLKQRNLEYLNMVKDRESIIMQYSIQIKKLNDEINNKNEQIKILIKFTKSINDENKSNVKELTKQACQTIKLLYNYNNQNNNLNNNNENLNNEYCINNIIKLLFNSEDLNDLNLNESINNKNNFKITFKLKEAIQDNLLLDNNDNIINIPREFLIDIIIKFNLLKIELHSSFLREFHFVNFLNSLMDKLNIKNIKEFNIVDSIDKMYEIKTKYENLQKQNEELKMKIIIYKKKINELNLYIEKLKDEVKMGKNKIKENIRKIINLYTINNNEFNIQFKKIKNDNHLKEPDKNQKKLNNSYNNNNEDNYNINNNIKIPNEYSNKNKKIKHFKSLKLENKISFHIINKSPNNSINNHKSTNKKLFDFSQLNNNETSNNNKNNNSNNSSLNTLTFQQKEPINRIINNNDSFNEKNYQQKRIENDKLKEEISYLKDEIKELLQDINKHQKLFYEKNLKTKNDNNYNSNNNSNNNNIKCEKCEYINNFMIRSNIPDSHKLIEIKNIILSCPSFDENIKNIINNIFDLMNILLTNNFIEKYHSTIEVSNTINTNNASSNFATLHFENYNKSNDLLFFTELNIKIFSSSELKKYHIIYNEKEKNINELIDIYTKRVDDIKNNINGIKFSYETSISSNNNDDIECHNIYKNINYYENNNIKINKKEINIPRISDTNNNNNSKQLDPGYDYKNIHEEIMKLKNEKIIIDNLIELIKNYLIINEKIFQHFIVQNKNIDKYKKYSNKIFKIFKECCYYNIDDISDNNIFYKKLIIKLFEISFLHI